MSQRDKSCFLIEKLSKSSEYYYLEPGLYPSFTDIVEAMNTLIQERHNYSTNCVTVKRSRGTQKKEIHPANERSGLAFFSTDLGNTFSSNDVNEFGVMLRGKSRHKTEFAHDLVRMHSLVIYTDLIECNNVGDTRAPLLRCFLFISKLKAAGDIITTRQCMNYQSFSNVQFRPLLKKSFHSIHIDLRDTSDEEIAFLTSVGITRLVLMFNKTSNILLCPKRRYKIVASRQIEIPFCRLIGRQRRRGFDALAQNFVGTANPLWCKNIVQAAKRVGADLLQFAVPEVADVVSCGKNFKTAAKSVGGQTLRKQLNSG